MIKENFVRLFESSIKNNWELPALTDYIEKNTLTYGEVGEEVAKLHLLFDNIGIQQGDKISLIGKNGVNWCITYIATVTYGAVIVPILQDFAASNVQHIVNHSDSVLLFTSDNIWETLEEERSQICVPSFHQRLQMPASTRWRNNTKRDQTPTNKFQKQVSKGFAAAGVLYPTIPNSELACISYTSGTTCFSKGVMLTGNNLAGNIVFGFETHLIERNDRQLAFLPLAHAYGCAFDFLTAFCAGAHTTFLGKIPSPKILLKAFAEIQPICIFTVPLIIEKCIENRYSQCSTAAQCDGHSAFHSSTIPYWVLLEETQHCVWR